MYRVRQQRNIIVFPLDFSRILRVFNKIILRCARILFKLVSSRLDNEFPRIFERFSSAGWHRLRVKYKARHRRDVVAFRFNFSYEIFLKLVNFRLDNILLREFTRDSQAQCKGGNIWNIQVSCVMRAISKNAAGYGLSRNETRRRRGEENGGKCFASERDNAVATAARMCQTQPNQSNYFEFPISRPSCHRVRRCLVDGTRRCKVNIGEDYRNIARIRSA